MFESVPHTIILLTMSNHTVKTILTGEADGRIETILGWIRTKRDAKNVVFIEINDGSCLKNLQAVIDKNSGIIDSALNHRLLTGASVKIVGFVQPCEVGNQSLEIQVQSVELIGDAPTDYPLQKKRHSFEFLREISHLRARTNTFGAVNRVRNCLARGIHDFFQHRGFLWIHTPIITGSDTEGAGNMFQVTNLNMETPPRDEEGKISYSEDFFGKKAHLSVSGQLQAENLACAMGRVYTFGPTFRAENSNTSRHLSEFWMVEPEMAFFDIEDNRILAEELIKALLQLVLSECTEDMDFFDRWICKGIIKELEEIISIPFVHISYGDAIKELQTVKDNFEFKPIWGVDLQAEHEHCLTDKIIKGPVTITDYPKDIKAFYMKQNDDGQTVRAMDVLVPRLGEIIGGSQREDVLENLLQRIKDMDMSTREYQWYLDLRRYGSVPHSGFGLGFDRLVQYVTGMQNIRDVIPFPRTPKLMDF